MGDLTPHRGDELLSGVGLLCAAAAGAGALALGALGRRLGAPQ
ncbi:MAG: hypothetical protein ACKVWR_03450 [Acidimicrobiales bacterium]